MTFEWALLISVLAICGTVIYLLKRQPDPEIHKEVKELWLSVNELLSRVTAVKEDHAAVHRMAEETQKALSQMKLAQGLRLQR